MTTLLEASHNAQRTLSMALPVNKIVSNTDVYHYLFDNCMRHVDGNLT